MSIVVPILMIVIGLAMAAIWTRDILGREHVDLSAGVFRARDAGTGALFWPHWLAEYGTAMVLVVGGIGLLVDAPWSTVVAAVATGALLYTSMNSLGWALARRERVPYAFPMVAGLAVGIVSTVFLLVR